MWRPLSKKGVVDGLAPGLNSIRPGPACEAPIGLIKKASTNKHGFRRGEFQYGVFRISVRIPNFTTAHMSPRESHLLAVEVVIRCAPNLHIYNSTGSSRSIFSQRMSVDLLRYHPLPTVLKNSRSYEPHYRTLAPPH